MKKKRMMMMIRRVKIRLGIDPVRLFKAQEKHQNLKPDCSDSSKAKKK